MTRILLTGLAATLLQLQPAFAAEAPDTCGTGRLVDAELVTDVVAIGTTSVTRIKHNRDGERREYTHTTPNEQVVRTYVITVELDGVRYEAKSSADVPWNYNPTRMVINDPIGVCVDRKHLIVNRPDGKTFKSSIVRATRQLD